MRRLIGAASLVVIVAAAAQIALLTLAGRPAVPGDTTALSSPGAAQGAARSTIDGAASGSSVTPAADGAGGVFADMRRNSFYALAGAILDDPPAFNARARQSYADSLRDADAALAAGDGRRAALILDDLERTLGPRPDVRLRLAALSALGDRPDVAAWQLNAMLALPLHDAAGLFAMLNGRLAAARDDVTRANLTRIAELADWREVRARNGLPVERVRAGTDGPFLVLELYLDDLPDGVPAQADDLGEGTAAYVQDLPGLRDLSWAADLHAAAVSAVSGGAEVLALPHAAFDGFNPSRVVVGSTLSLELRGPAARAVLVGASSYSFEQLGEETCAPTVRPEECTRPAYAIIARRP